jgi:hypothetical protein
VSRTRKPLHEIIDQPADAEPDAFEALADTAEQQRLQGLAQTRWSELDQLARPAREYRYLGGSDLANIIVSITRVAPVSAGEVAILTDRREEYIREVLEHLVETGKLRLLYPDQLNHGQQKYLAKSGGGKTVERAAPVRPPVVSLNLNRISRASPVTLNPPAPPEPVELPLPAKVERETPPPPPVELGRLEPAVPTASAASDRIRTVTWNAATNSVATVVSGIVLGVWMPRVWWLIGLLIAAGLATIHVATRSTQYQRYLNLDPSRSQGSFILLKGLVSYVEIVVVALIISWLR